MALRPERCLLPQLLKRRGLSQVDLAQKTGLTETTISLYANNHRVMSLANAKTIANVLKVTIDELYTWVEL